MLIDSHCHLDHLNLENFDHSLDTLLSDARARGVERFLTVGVNLEKSRQLIDLSEQRAEVVCSVGVHPLQESSPPLPEVAELMALSSHPRVVAIGETGLDYYYDKGNAQWQQQSFQRHLETAVELEKPVIVHTRNAQQDTLTCLEAYSAKGLKGVLHCFTESWEMAQAALEMGLYISFSGIITFKNAAPLREVVARVPLEKLLVETDAPWLAPVPYRGKQNQPGYVAEVAEAVAAIKGISKEAVAQRTTDNFFQLFGWPEE